MKCLNLLNCSLYVSCSILLVIFDIVSDALPILLGSVLIKKWDCEYTQSGNEVFCVLLYFLNLYFFFYWFDHWANLNSRCSMGSNSTEPITVYNVKIYKFVCVLTPKCPLLYFVALNFFCYFPFLTSQVGIQLQIKELGV